MSFDRPIATSLVALFAAYQWLTWGCLDYTVPVTPPGRRRVVTVSSTRARR